METKAISKTNETFAAKLVTYGGMGYKPVVWGMVTCGVCFGRHPKCPVRHALVIARVKWGGPALSSKVISVAQLMQIQDDCYTFHLNDFRWLKNNVRKK
jgi:hypothetical protein